MASLDKLAIRGIRSFDDKGINIIQFYNPLTVIVGYNGSGKTTIIECLKYATTGDLPPNTKGGAFVHDPTMAATNEVKAQVRLRFYNTNHVRINCVRNLQVSKKKTTGLTMKTLESLLQVDDENKKNKRTVLSTKCADLDTEIPRLLGVSKAILDNVIFCHQEESNWPLSEPATLKKKFDDIFEATRYTKALDNIKSLRKEQAVELKVQHAELEGLRTDKERADAIKDKKRRLESSLAEKESHLDDLNETIEKLTNDNKDFYNKAVQFRETVARAEAMEEKIKLFTENMEELRSTMTPIDEPEAELQKRKERFGEHLDQQRRRKAELNRKVEDKKDEVARLESLRGRKMGEKGGLENDRKHHHQAVEAREAEIRSMSGELGIKGFDTAGLSDSQIGDFEARVGESARRVSSELQALRSDGAKKDAEMTAQWQELRSELRAKQTERENAGDAMRKLRDRIKRAQDDLDGVAVTSADVEAATKDWEDAKAKSSALKAETTRADLDGRTREKNKEIRDLDQAREDLTVELNSLNRHADFRARLDVKKTERSNKEQEIQSLLQVHGAAIEHHTGREPVALRLESDINQVVASKEGDLSTQERSDAAASKELQRIESSLSFARATLRDMKARADGIEQEIRLALTEGGFDDLPAAMRECEKETHYLSEVITGASHAAEFFKRVKTAAQTRHSCLACNRGISDEELPGISTWIEAQIRKTTPSSLEESARELQDWKAQLADFQALVPKQATLDALRQTDVPAEERKVKKEEERLAAATTAAERSSAAVEALRAELREIASLKKAASDVSRLLKETTALSRDVEGLESDLLSTGTMRTSGDVQQEIDALTDKLKRAKRELLDLQSQREHQHTKQQQYERDAHQAEMSVAAKRQEHSKREALLVRAQELKAELADAQKAAQTLDDDIAKAGPPIRRAKEALDALKADQTSREQALHAETSRLSGLVKHLRDLNEQAGRYVAQRGSEKLRECEDAISDLQSQIQTVQKSITAVEVEAAKTEKDLNESKATERNIHDNLRHRHLQAEVQRIQAEHDELNLDEASEASKTWTAKYNNSKKKENELNGEAAHLGGEISSLRSQITGREQELKEDYKNVEKRYTAKLIAFKTGEMANRDLELYGKALDNAIMRYHAIKMEEINEQIRYLWGRTYQGTDIDTISIRSDNEGNKAGRSYYYRVCMVKDTVEMDMRGRCSAGQKVLASIIIRLALADSFGENCGILALDEPTTNLDKENIVALAKSLNDVIRERRNQSNFQLIVITHDEEFLTMLGQSDSLEYYWRCSRNAQQKSIIERESIQ